MEIHESMNMHGIYLLRKMGYISYSKKINASHICPPEGHKWFEQRKWKLMFSGKHGLWPANYISKSVCWWKHEMILRSIRTFCPKPFAGKPQQKISVWRKCWVLVLQQKMNLENDKIDLAKKSWPPDCAITSVLSHKYVCFHVQPQK